MILIINGQKDDSTDNICKWLLYYGKEFIRIDEESVLSKINIDLINGLCEIEINNIIKIDFRFIKSIFYKNGSFNYEVNTKKEANRFIREFNSRE